MLFLNSRSTLIPGVRVTDGDAKYVVLDLANLNSVLVRDEAGKKLLKSVEEISLDIPDISVPRIHILDVTDKDWDEACRIADALAPLVELGKYRRAKSDINAVAEKLDKHISTVYRWLDVYEKTGLVSSLLRKSRADKGITRLTDEMEKIIQDCIDEYYLKEQKPTIQKTYMAVKGRCRSLNLSPPDMNTVRNRILAIPEINRVSAREGRKEADEKYSPLRGHFPGGDYPLAVVQIDHTPVDVIVVDDTHRKPIGRPYLTIAIDVYSKMIVGFYLSLETPGALATGICISRAIMGKESYLRQLDIDLDWPCWGLMRTIHTDNAKEFRGTMLGRAAKQYVLNCERRPKGKPKYGGHVERAFRTYMNTVHNELPGTTFSNVKFKKEYDSEGRAVMTLDALEVWFTLFLLGVYHQTPHEGNNKIPPIVKWERGLLGDETTMGRGIPPRHQDEETLKLDFLPYFERTVQEYGIQFEGINYWDDSLRAYIHAKDPNSIKNKRLFICKYDPRNLSCIWMHDPEKNQYIEIPYRDLTRAPISLWELKMAKKTIRADSVSSTNEELIFRTIDKMRLIVEDESQKTKKARKQQQRQKHWAKSTQKIKPDIARAVEKAHVKDECDDDIDIEPFFDIREG